MSLKNTLILGIGLVISFSATQDLEAQLFRSRNRCTCPQPVVNYCPAQQNVVSQYATPIVSSTPAPAISNSIVTAQPTGTSQPIVTSQPIINSQPIVTSTTPAVTYPVLDQAVSSPTIVEGGQPMLTTPTIESTPQTLTNSPTNGSEGVVILDSVSDVPTSETNSAPATTPAVNGSFDNVPTPAPVPTGDTNITPEAATPPAEETKSVLSGT